MSALDNAARALVEIARQLNPDEANSFACQLLNALDKESTVNVTVEANLELDDSVRPVKVELV